jgi:hypothetical protein
MTNSSTSSIGVSAHQGAQSTVSLGPQWTSLTGSKTDMVMTIGEADLIFEADNVRLHKESEDLDDRIQRLEHMLGVTERNPVLEERHPELKAIGEQMDREVTRVWRESASNISMIAAEYQDFIEQCRLMDKLKENNDT